MAAAILYRVAQWIMGVVNIQNFVCHAKWTAGTGVARRGYRCNALQR